MTTERDIKNQIAFAEKKGIEKERQRILEALRSQGVPEDILAKAILTPEGQ